MAKSVTCMVKGGMHNGSMCGRGHVWWGMCDRGHVWRGHVWQGHVWQETWVAGACVVGHVWWSICGGALWQGACVAGEMATVKQSQSLLGTTRRMVRILLEYIVVE